MYDDSDGEEWREGFRLTLPPRRWLYAAAGLVVVYKLGQLIVSMKRRLETLEAILLDPNPPPPRR